MRDVAGVDVDVCFAALECARLYRPAVQRRLRTEPRMPQKSSPRFRVSARFSSALSAFFDHARILRVASQQRPYAAPAR